MKKRILSLALVLMLALSLLPMAALAASGEPTPEPAEPTGESVEETVAESTPEATPEAMPEPTAEPSGEPDEAAPLALEGAPTALAEVTNNGNTSTVYYSSDLGDALTERATTRVKLLADVEIESAAFSSTCKIKSSDLTLDLNGFDLAIKSEIYIGSDDPNNAFTAKLTITDSSADAAGELSASRNIYVASGSTLSINSGALKANNSGIFIGFIYVYGAMNVSGSAEVSASKGVSVSDSAEVMASRSGSVYESSASLTVTGGRFPGAVFISGGKVSLSGGDFGQIQAASGIDLTDVLADGYAFYERDLEGNYNTLSKPQTDEETGDQSVYCVQVKAHSCTLTLQSDGTYSCTKDGGCGRSGMQAAVKYLDENGAEKECTKYTVVKSDTTTWNSGWYVVKDSVTLEAPVTISEKSDVHLILCDGKTLTVTGGTISIDGFADEQSLTIYGQSGGTGALKAQSADVTEADGDAESNGMKLYRLTVNGGHVTAISGNTASGTDYACSEGIEAVYLTINGGSLTATGGNAASETGDAYSRGTDVTYLTVNGGSLTGNCATATAQEEYGYACENGLAAAYLTVAGGTVTATGGTAENAFDLLASWEFTLSGGTVKSGRADGVLQLSTDALTVSGGTMKLAGGSFFSSAEVKDGASLADLLADGLAFRKLRCVWTTYYAGDWDDDYDYDYDETDEGLVPLAGRTALDEDYNEDYNDDDEDVYVLTRTWCYYYVEPCTHSTSDGVCAYCGKSVTSGSGNNGGTTPAPTATPKPAQSPKTGDEAMPALWLALALSVMAVAVVSGKRRVK